MKKIIIHIAVVTTMAKLYGVAFNPWANYSRHLRRRKHIERGIALAGSFVQAGYPVSSLVREAFHAHP
ncbi:hypothetical protein HQ397_04160 [Aeromonas hydrophila]|uniref:hypothetical protein n=1 Tax=Aeromonas hydrophila TaxID=644 RepID=UPI001C760A1C|nr:hypothetical protein [Aeromonas hydrophila]QWL69402.1 hypothetical protein HQ397_04160 [Aeromonas hydrophila]